MEAVTYAHKLAQEAMLELNGLGPGDDVKNRDLVDAEVIERAIDAALAHERERCAKLVEEGAAGVTGSLYLAARIRSLGPETT